MAGAGVKVGTPPPARHIVDAGGVPRHPARGDGPHGPGPGEPPSPAPSPPRGRGLTRNAGTLAAATLTSRFTGFIRDAAIVAVFGATGAGPWILAWTLPNSMRRLVAEGSLTVSFLPLFTEQLEVEGAERARQFFHKSFTLAALGLAALVALAIALMPQIIGLWAGEWRASDPARFALTVQLARVAFPYLWMVGLVAVAMGLLNALRRFFVPAVSPVLVNLGLIGGALGLARVVHPAILGLALGLLAGGVLQLILNLVALARAGYAPRLDFRFRDPAIKRLLALMLPATFGASIYQVNTLLSRGFAASVGSSAVTWLYTADRLVELPLGIVAVSVAMAALPELSTHVAAGNMGAYKDTLASALRQVLFVMLPAAVGLSILAVPIVSVVFQHGAFAHADTRRTAAALVLYAMGIPAIGSARVMVQGFYALQDTRTPVVVGVVAVCAFAGSALAFMPHFGYLGIALAGAIAPWVNLATGTFLLRRKAGRLRLRSILRSGVRSAVGCVVMAAAAFAVSRLGVWEGGARRFDLQTLANVGVLLAAVGIGAGAYFAVTVAAGSPEASALLRVLRRRFGGRRA